MSIVVMKRRFEAPPSKDEIMGLMVGEVGDKSQAKAALLNILSPMKDILAALAYTETLDAAAGQYAELLKEKDSAVKNLEAVKTQTIEAKKLYDAAAKNQAEIAAKILDLKAERDAVAAEIVNEEEAKLRVNKAVEAEYDRIRKDMLAKVADEENAARKELGVIKAQISLAQTELDTLAEKKRAFIASLGG